MPSQEEIYTRVTSTIVEALNVDEEEIQPTATLQGDLGAESIDFLDIVFRLEREFGIKIPRADGVNLAVGEQRNIVHVLTPIAGIDVHVQRRRPETGTAREKGYAAEVDAVVDREVDVPAA